VSAAIGKSVGQQTGAGESLIAASIQTAIPIITVAELKKSSNLHKSSC
jgi:hypothetical protein